MATVTPKQQEISRRRYQVLEVARDLFRELGYLGLNMDRIAAEMDVAKGTIYQHFKNKEEIILALAVETLEKRTAMFEKAAVVRSRPRVRMAAIGCAAELFVIRFPDHFELEKVLGCNSIIKKTSEKLQMMKTGAESKCINLAAGVVRDGIAAGDLQLPDGVQPEQLVFGLWSLSYGGYSIMDSTQTLDQMGIDDGFQLVRNLNNRLLDGYGWKPLSTRFDYNAVFAQTREEVFHDSR